MSLFKYLYPWTYLKRIKHIYKKIKKGLQVNSLEKLYIEHTDIQKIWSVTDLHFTVSSLNEYVIFGKSVHLKNINWHKDYISGFVYPLKRFDRLNISNWFDKGIDVKFPWEVSRFYFAIKIAQNYLISKDEKHYIQFKKLFLDWIEKNPFFYGVNWICTMEVAIRAINWIVAVNLFGEIFKEDKEFQKKFSKSLVQHAEYISRFPEVYKNGNTTNHTTSDYTGLLFLAMALKEHPKSNKWLKQATQNLTLCLEHQVYNDGMNFEASIPYHRLVLELFGFASVLCKANNVELPVRYYLRLFKMFEFTAAYLDQNGNAPQAGDNDSGRVLIFHDSDEHDHSYLLDLGEHIFEYNFLSQCEKRINQFRIFLPEIQKIKMNEINAEPRQTDKSIAFKNGGAYILKNEEISLFISCFPIGQNGMGGHNHNDFGSFTLSYNGHLFFADPGTFVYSRNIHDRNEFRSSRFHNIVMINDIEQNYYNSKIENLWNAIRRIDVKIEDFYFNSETDFLRIYQKIDLNVKSVIYIREFYFSKHENKIQINDIFELDHIPDCLAEINFILFPDVTTLLKKENEVALFLKNSVNVFTNYKCMINTGRYSYSYNNEVPCSKITEKIKISNQNKLITTIELN